MIMNVKDLKAEIDDMLERQQYILEAVEKLFPPRVVTQHVKVYNNTQMGLPSGCDFADGDEVKVSGFNNTLQYAITFKGSVRLYDTSADRILFKHRFSRAVYVPLK